MTDERIFAAKKDEELKEGKDYYVENGFFVMTKRYLLKRGFCCKSGCRHCPYEFEKDDCKEV